MKRRANFPHNLSFLYVHRFQKKRYLVFFSHYLEWIAYVSALAYIFPACDCKLGYKQEVGAIALFFVFYFFIRSESIRVDPTRSGGPS